jgi:hypothetical protein
LIKFVIDEDISISTGKTLEQAGYKVFDIRDYNLRGSNDDIIFKFE